MGEVKRINKGESRPSDDKNASSVLTSISDTDNVSPANTLASPVLVEKALILIGEANASAALDSNDHSDKAAAHDAMVDVRTASETHREFSEDDVATSASLLKHAASTVLTFEEIFAQKGELVMYIKNLPLP